MFSMWHMIYGEEPVEFDVAVDSPVALARLRTGMRGSIYGFTARPFIYGRVDDTQITAQYTIPFVSNGFKPILFATCASENGGTVVRGIYRCHRFTQVFVAVWLLFMGLYAAFALSQQVPWIVVLWPMVIMFALLWAITAFGRWLARKDRDHIQKMLCDMMMGTYE